MEISYVVRKNLLCSSRDREVEVRISPATLCYLVSALPGLWLQKLYYLGHYGTIANISLATVPSTSVSLDFSAEDWMLLSEQTMMVTIILSRWLLPKGSMTHNEVSQLLLLYLSLSSDIIDFLTIFGFSQVAEDEAYCYVLLFWWTLAMLQFTLDLTSTHNDDDDNTTTNNNKNTTTNNDGTNNNSDTDTELNNDTTKEKTQSAKNENWSTATSRNFEDSADDKIDVERGEEKDGAEEKEGAEDDGAEEKAEGTEMEGGLKTLTLRGVLCSSELWAILVVFLLQDGPFLANRLVVMMYFKVFNYTIIFFICKNSLVLALQTYRVIVLYLESKAKVPESKAKVKAAMKARRYSKISLYSFGTLSTIEEVKSNDDDDDEDNYGNNDDGSDGGGNDNFDAKDVVINVHRGTASDGNFPVVVNVREQQVSSSVSAYKLISFGSAAVGKARDDNKKLPPPLSFSAARDHKIQLPQLLAPVRKIRRTSETSDDQRHYEDTSEDPTRTSRDRSSQNTTRRFTEQDLRLNDSENPGREKPFRQFNTKRRVFTKLGLHGRPLRGQGIIL